MIRIKNLTKTYPGPLGPISAIEAINLNIHEGEIFGIIGKSGAGKSTLLRCINFLEQPTSGTVTIQNDLLNEMSKSELRNARQHIAMIFQHFNLLSNKTVFDNIALPLRFARWDEKKITNTVKPLIGLTGLNEKEEAYPAQLSGGQKQRVAIARALANQPNVLLCDEATSALDPQTTQDILQLLQAINQSLGLTIILITHEMDVIKTICDRVAVMDDGKIIEEGEIHNIFVKPKQTVTKELVRAAISRKLPDSITQKLSKEKKPDTFPLWQIAFHGAAASEPIIAHLIQQLKLDLNILQANIDYIKQEPLGVMIVEADGDEKALQAGLKYLRDKHLTVEELGYVPRYVVRTA